MLDLVPPCIFYLAGTLSDHAKGSSRKVAIKIPKVTTFHQGHKEEMRDFCAEAQVSLSLSHENVLSCLGVTQDLATNIPWLVFEYMEHGDLADLLRENSGMFKPLPPATSKKASLPPLDMVRMIKKHPLQWVE